MSDVAVLYANLMVLLAVGSASREYISKHKRLGEYTIEHFEILSALIGEFSDIVLLPHVLAETSNLSRQAGPLGYPARAKIQAVLKKLIYSCIEYPIASMSGVAREEFDQLGLTDAVILHFCAMKEIGINPTLLTADTLLANAALSQGYSVIDYRTEFL